MAGKDKFMKLHEQLQALVDAGKITIEESKTLSDSVAVIKSSTKEKVTKELQVKLDEAHSKLSDYTKKERAELIKKSVAGLTDSEDKLKDAVALAGIADDDDADAIKSKVESVIESRSYLQAAKEEVTETVIVEKPKAEKPVEAKETLYSRPTTLK